MASDEIWQREQKNPHDVDKVPIQAHQFHWGVVLRREAASQRLSEKPQQQSGADDHVQRMQAGHREIQREKKLGVRIGGHVRARLKAETWTRNVVLDILVVIFDSL